MKEIAAYIDKFTHVGSNLNLLVFSYLGLHLQASCGTLRIETLRIASSDLRFLLWFLSPSSLTIELLEILQRNRKYLLLLESDWVPIGKDTVLVRITMKRICYLHSLECSDYTFTNFAEKLSLVKNRAEVKYILCPIEASSMKNRSISTSSLDAVIHQLIPPTTLSNLKRY
jgi:hypothetical protein